MVTPASVPAPDPVPEPAPAPATVPVPRGVRVGYGVGSVSTATFSTVPGLLLLFYMTNVLAVPAWIAGLVAFLPKVWDVVINPWVGQRSDRTVSRLGARRPWMLVGAITLPLAFAATFAGPPLTGLPAAAYVAVCYFLTATAYAFYEVPYKAMAAEMTTDYHERSAILQWKMVFVGLAILLSGAAAPAIAGSTVSGYRLMGLVVAAALFASMIASFLGTARAPVVTRAEAEASVRAQFAAARTNRPFMTLLGLSCAQMFAAGTLLAGAPYMATYTLRDPGATTTLLLCIVGPLLVTMPGWVWLSRRYDKRGAMVLASALFLAGTVGLALSGQLGAVYAHACVLVVGIGYSGLQLLQFSMLSDVIVYDEAVTGRRRAGVFTGLWTAAETVVFAFGALVYGWLLGAAGFVESDPKTPVEQPEAAVQAALYGGTLIPALLVAVAIWLTTRYGLTAERLASAGELRSAEA
ncbi:MFS transporter [Planomonospora venezuelensis]|uniref:GPH family glycoside/pentoside/hexuronide:cation symporter n=1 Tax=Planomonospora venezuelensis TaxID=1999 RepID=A0A841D3H1_PLAVE|nr:MFS transporter [Planomonospora venezuelensis]MBB5963054.1 GPH family glycoside/pentoside/hexuronide:cation symporter [Planomonospora venezuelensis]